MYNDAKFPTIVMKHLIALKDGVFLKKILRDIWLYIVAHFSYLYIQNVLATIKIFKIFPNKTDWTTCSKYYTLCPKCIPDI